jgi:putative ABC transport system permease protein
MVNASILGIRSRAGVAYVSPEVHVQLPLRTRPEQGAASLALVRGVTPAATLVHSSIQIVEGRFPQVGRSEVMVGDMIATSLKVAPSEVSLGKVLWIDRQAFTIVGRFVAPGSVAAAEVWASLAEIKQVTKRVTDSCVVVTLDPEKAEYADVAAFVKSRVDLELAATRETSYYAKLSTFFAPIRLVALVTAALIALGGLFGGLNTMYAAFVSRVRELGTLQSLGFRRAAIVVSLVQESMLATTLGALLACAVGVFALDGVAVRFSRGAFGLTVDTSVLAVGLSAGIVLGLVGALPPAWRCLRLTIPVALKAV